MKLKLILTGLALLLFARTTLAQKPIKVPTGKPILVDGKCGTEEWRGAAELNLSNGYKLTFKKAHDSVFVCIRPPQASHLSVDLYLAPADRKLYTLHVSAKLGERVLEGGQWKEWTTDWPWWEVAGWWANWLRPVNFEKRTFLPQQAIEMQLERQRFTGRRWRVMFDIAGRTVIFPDKADNLKTETWLELDLG